MNPRSTQKHLRIIIWRGSQILPILLLWVTGLVAGMHSTHAQCSGAPNFSMKNPKKVKGLTSSTKIGDQWVFFSAAPGIDVYIEIQAIKNATILLGKMDATKSDAGQGYDDAWQPYVNHSHQGNFDTSYLDWKIFFKKAGTQKDTILPCLSVTAVDVDGDNSGLKEFIEAGTPGGYAVQEPTTLTVSFDGTKSKAIGRVNTINLIDSSRREAMFQMNFAQVSSLSYRNGSIASGKTTQQRHTSIFFRPFFMNKLVVLPLRITGLTARRSNGVVTVDWQVEDEPGKVEYTVQRSPDQQAWEIISRQQGDPSVRGRKRYQAMDRRESSARTWYRLRQTDEHGRHTYTRPVSVAGISDAVLSVGSLQLKQHQLKVQVRASEAQNVCVSVHNLNGQLCGSKQFQLTGLSQELLVEVQHSPQSIGLVNIHDHSGKILYQSRLYTQ